MYCPECQAEYREGIYSCPECEVALVAELPVEEHPEWDFVPVFRTADVDLLPVIHSVLQAAGIPYTTQGEGTMGVLPGYGLALSTIFHVDRERRAEAQQLLETAVDERAQAGSEGDS